MHARARWPVGQKPDSRHGRQWTRLLREPLAWGLGSTKRRFQTAPEAPGALASLTGRRAPVRRLSATFARIWAEMSWPSVVTTRAIASAIRSYPVPAAGSITVERFISSSSPSLPRICQRASSVTSLPGYPSKRNTVMTTWYWDALGGLAAPWKRHQPFGRDAGGDPVGEHAGDPVFKRFGPSVEHRDLHAIGASAGHDLAALEVGRHDGRPPANGAHAPGRRHPIRLGRTFRRWTSRCPGRAARGRKPYCATKQSACACWCRPCTWKTSTHLPWTERTPAMSARFTSTRTDAAGIGQTLQWDTGHSQPIAPGLVRSGLAARGTGACVRMHQLAAAHRMTQSALSPSLRRVLPCRCHLSRSSMRHTFLEGLWHAARLHDADRTVVETCGSVLIDPGPPTDAATIVSVGW
jgi:hypothetical protein